LTPFSPRRLAAGAVLVAFAAGCGDGGREGWTAERARSITTIRGMNVHVLRCTPLGKGDHRRYTWFACEAGARRAGETYDTVGVLYEIRVDGERYALEDARFVGGPGVA
jgi:hypothetical protein